MSDIARARSNIFTACGCTRSRTAAVEKLPCPQQIWLREGSCHDVRSVKEQAVALPTTTLIGDSAYADAAFSAELGAQGTILRTPCKKLKGQEVSYKGEVLQSLRESPAPTRRELVCLDPKENWPYDASIVCTLTTNS